MKFQTNFLTYIRARDFNIYCNDFQLINVDDMSNLKNGLQTGPQLPPEPQPHVHSKTENALDYNQSLSVQTNKQNYLSKNEKRYHVYQEIGQV